MRLTLRNITIGFKDKTSPLIEDVNVEAYEGTFIALVGRNGSGKSTLLRSLAGLVKPRCGEILLDNMVLANMSVADKAQKIAFVSTEIVRVAHLRVWDIVALGRAPYSSWSGALSDEDEIAVEQALQRVGMTDFKNVNIDRLSDGERGRVMIARALAQQSDLILLDEPTAFLDLPNRHHIMKLLQELAHEEGKLIVLSTHELSLALDMVDYLWIIAEGHMTAGSTIEVSNSEALKSVMRF